MVLEDESRIRMQMAAILTVLSSAELRNEREQQAVSLCLLLVKKKKVQGLFWVHPKPTPGFCLLWVRCFLRTSFLPELPSTPLPSPHMLAALTAPSSAPPPN